MFQYKYLEQNILINYITPDKKNGNTIHYLFNLKCYVGHVTLLLQKYQYLIHCE